MKKHLKKIFINMEKKTVAIVKYFFEYKNLYNKKKLWKNIELSKEQKNEIKINFKENYGRNFSNKWHRLYQSYTGSYNKDYFPEILFSTKLEFVLNDYETSKRLSDKSLFELIYKNIKNLYFPKMYLLNSCGIWYDENRNIIQMSDAIDSLKNKEVLIKPTIDSSSGKNVKIYNFKEDKDLETGTSIADVLKYYNKNFVVQERLHNCKEISKIYSHSINTIRMITYTINGKLYHTPISLRMGVKGNFVDNAHAGGIAVGVSKEGILKKFAFKEDGTRYDKHPDSDFVFEGYKIPKMKEIIDTAYECHKLTPGLRILSWDFAIDENENINLIEVNPFGQSIWFPQYINGESLFGENTKYMYSLIKK